ncbi:MAG: flippase-like domain-containing protein [Chlorobi bacterium]|nr:flippase-like domain-containing protein [Chlorobiota bacterium]
MKNIFLKSLKYFFFLLIAILLLYYAFKGVDLKKVKEAFTSANYFWVLLSIIAAFIAYVSRALRWKLLIEPMGFNPKTSNTYHALMVGYFANIAFPRLGELVRCGSLNKSEKIPVNKLFGTVLIERASDLIVLLFLLIFVFVIEINVFGAFLKEYIFSPFYRKFQSLFTFSLTAIIVYSVVFLFILFFFLYRQKIGRLRSIRKFKLLLYGVMSGFKTIIHMKKRRYYIMHTIIIWVMYFFMTYLVFFSLEATSGLKPIDGLFLTIVGGIGMSLPAPGGIGSYHYFISLGLSLYGISKESGIAFATIVHESQALFVIIMGITSLLILFFKRKRIAK